MYLNEYQDQARETAIYPKIGHRVVYPTLGLANEAGEFAGKIKKVFRDNLGYITPKTQAELKAELGDVLWYLAMCACELGLELEEIAQDNLDKLASRKAREKLQGSGDNR